MGNRPILAGSPTVEINIERYEELIAAETKWFQYMNAIKNVHPELVDVIEAVETVIEESESESIDG